jgi:hypothetical protein
LYKKKDQGELKKNGLMKIMKKIDILVSLNNIKLIILLNNQKLILMLIFVIIELLLKGLKNNSFINKLKQIIKIIKIIYLIIPNKNKKLRKIQFLLI